MRTVFIGLEKLHRVRRYRRQTQFTGQLQRATDMDFHRHRCRADSHRLRTQALHFEIKPPGEQPRPVLRQPARIVILPRNQRLADVALMSAGQRNQTAGADLVEPRLHHLGTAAILVAAVGPGQQFAQAQVTLVVLRQQQYAKRVVAVGLVAQQQVAANDRFDAFATRRLIELDHAKDVAEVGQCQCRHAVGFRRSYCVVDAHNAIDDGIFAVKAEVNERRLHSALFYGVPTPGLMRADRFVLHQ